MSLAYTDREQLVAGAFVELADSLVDDYDVIDVLDRLVGHSVTLLAADAAGIMLVDARGRLRVVASSSEQSDWTELMQVQADEGPCIDCVRTGRPVTITDLDTAAARWPRFAASLHERTAPDHHRYRSVHALPLRLGQALADVATIGILQERAVRHGEILTGQLQTALNSRVIIEQAKGVLAQVGGLPMEAAFDRLRGHARSRNLRLVDVARRVVTERDSAREVLGIKVGDPTPS